LLKSDVADSELSMARRFDLFDRPPAGGIDSPKNKPFRRLWQSKLPV
jgi:hypothetical protein